LAGPGDVWLLTRIESIERKFSAREQTLEIQSSMLNFAGVNFIYTVALNYRIDPESAAKGDDAQFTRFLQFEEHEFGQKMRTVVRSLLPQVVADLAAEKSAQLEITTKTPIAAKLSALRLGGDYMRLINQCLADKLSEQLPSVGVVLVTDQPVVITNFAPDEGLAELLRREREAASIRQQWADLPAEMQAQMYASVKDLSLPQVQKHIVETSPGNQLGVHLAGNSPMLDIMPPEVKPPEKPAGAESGATQTPAASAKPLLSSERQPSEGQNSPPIDKSSVQNQAAFGQTGQKPIEAIAHNPITASPISGDTTVSSNVVGNVSTYLSKEDLSLLKPVPPLRSAANATESRRAG
jgi:hypothetical protein